MRICVHIRRLRAIIARKELDPSLIIPAHQYRSDSRDTFCRNRRKRHRLRQQIIRCLRQLIPSIQLHQRIFRQCHRIDRTLLKINHHSVTFNLFLKYPCIGYPCSYGGNIPTRSNRCSFITETWSDIDNNGLSSNRCEYTIPVVTCFRYCVVK